MFYLIATILLNTIIYIIFSFFTKLRINSLNAIVFNYWVCVITGSVFYGSFPVGAASASQSWFLWAVINGFIFIGLFRLMSYCTSNYGITTTTIANKLSLVIPVLFSVFLYHEHATWVKILGILIAIPAIYLTSRTDTEGKTKNIFFPVLLFFGSGLLDTLIKYIEQKYLDTNDMTAVFTIHLFLFAAIAGSIWMLVNMLRSKEIFTGRDAVAGLALGIPNYFSIYFFIRYLNSDLLESSAAIPVNNIGIVLVSSLVAILFLREKLTAIKAAGLVLSIIAILLIAFSNG